VGCHRIGSGVARDGARPLYLDVLPDDDAIALVAARIGSARASAELAAVPRLVEACANLPLALNIAAAILLTSPDAAVATLAGELATARGGLDRLDAGDAASSARVVFASSYIDRLKAEEDRDAAGHALGRLLEWYLRTADDAARVINSRRRHASLDHPRSEVRPLSFTAYEHALAWLDVERGNLVAAVSLAAEHGHDEIAWKLPVTLWDLCTLRGLFDDWISTHRTGLVSARKLDEKFGQTWLLNNLSAVYLLQDRLDDAAGCIDEALPISSELGNTRGQASLLHNGGIVQIRQGRYDVALPSIEAALALYDALGDSDGEGHARQSMGEALQLRGDLDDALACYEKALARFTETGNRFSESLVFINIAQVHRGRNGLIRALRAARHAVTLSREVGHRPGEAEALALTGDLQDEIGQRVQARRSWRLAACIFGELGDSRAGDLLARAR
jgi:tetratricopeptide (TPR) repeat protein